MLPFFRNGNDDFFRVVYLPLLSNVNQENPEICGLTGKRESVS
jgi:hypothetical protein